jgi:hypothetical protein
MLSFGIDLRLLLGLSCLLGCLLLGVFLRPLLLTPPAYCAYSCTYRGACPRVTGDRTNRSAPGSASRGTSYRSSLWGCLSGLVGGLLLGCFLLLGGGRGGRRSFRIKVGLLFGRAVTLILIPELLVRTLLVLGIGEQANVLCRR